MQLPIPPEGVIFAAWPTSTTSKTFGTTKTPKEK